MNTIQDIKISSKRLNSLKISISDDSMDIDTYWCRVATPKDYQDSKPIAPHHHTFYEIHYCLQGNAHFQVNNEQDICLSKGSFVIFPPHFLHQSLYFSNFIEFVCGLNIDLKSQHIDYCFLSNALFHFNPLVCYTGTERLEKYVEDMLTYAKVKINGQMLSLSSTMKLFIIEICRIILPSAIPEVVVSRNRSGDVIIDYIRDFIKENLQFHITCADIAQQMNFSVRHLNRITQQHLGVTLQHMINDIKLEETRQLLTNTDLPLHDIAERIGYSSEFSLNRFFKINEGMSPGRYRQSQKF